MACGAIVTSSLDVLAELVYKIFTNKMDYIFKSDENEKGYFRLFEKQTDSMVRLQTNDKMLSEAFWNNYHNIV